MSHVEDKGKIKTRDALFLEAVRGLENSEMRWMLLSNDFMYQPAARARMLSEAKLTSKTTNRFKRSVSTLSETQQKNIEACRQLLDARYNVWYRPLVQMRDLTFNTKSCDLTGV